MAGVIGVLSSSNVDAVIDAYQNALLARFPRARYVIGPDSHLVWLPGSWLPEWITDFLMGLIDVMIPLPASMKKTKVD